MKKKFTTTAAALTLLLASTGAHAWDGCGFTALGAAAWATVSVAAPGPGTVVALAVYTSCEIGYHGAELLWDYFVE